MSTTMQHVVRAVERQARMKSTERTHIHVMGLSGWGKTRMLEAICQTLTTACPLMPKDDIVVPAKQEDGTMVLMLHPTIQDFLDDAEANPTKLRLWILDEIMQASQDDQKAYASIIYDRAIAGRKLPPNVLTVSTGNQRKHQSGVGSSMAHLINRMKVYEIEPDVEGWLDWGATRLHTDVQAYIVMKPSAAYCTNDNPTDEAMAEMYRAGARDFSSFPTARSWTALSDELKKYPDMDVDDMASHVGKARALEFHALRGMEIPSHEDLIEGKAEFPTDPMQKWVAIIRAGQKLTVGTSVKTLRMVLKQSPEMVEVFLRVAGKTAIEYIKTNGTNTFKDCDYKQALFSYPGFREEVFGTDSRYSRSLEVRR